MGLGELLTIVCKVWMTWLATRIFPQSATRLWILWPVNSSLLKLRHEKFDHVLPTFRIDDS
jgi:hypothetical protein